MAQLPNPTFINLPPSGMDRSDTPSEMPGTPNSATTSLSTLSTIAIKDGHRGHMGQNTFGRGQALHPSATSLEAERADRISRLAGLERMSPMRAPLPQSPAAPGGGFGFPHLPSPSAGFPPSLAGPGGGQYLLPVYFDAAGQPVSTSKMSTVGTASATDGTDGTDGTEGTDLDDEDARTTTEDDDKRSIDMRSTDANSRGADQPDEDENMTSRSGGAVEDRWSDDGSASLVGFGEGAGSTGSGPTSQRRTAPAGPGSLERSASLSEALAQPRLDRDSSMAGGAEHQSLAVSALQQ